MRDASDLLVNSHIILNGTLACTIENYVISFYWCELDGNCEVLLLYLFVVDVQFFTAKRLRMTKKILVGVVSVMLALVASAAGESDRYLAAIDAAVSAYSREHLDAYLDGVEKQGVQEHGFPRLAANLGILVSRGRRTEMRETLRRMMDVSCRCAAAGVMPPKSGGNEFSVKELVVALVSLERAGTFPKTVTDAWREMLSKVVAETCYTQGRCPLGSNRACNWAVFGAASEQARLAHGMGGDPAFVERYVRDQLRWFDANGMYRDPDQPAVYDLVTRLQFMNILDWGYDGPSRPALEAVLDKSAEPTLAMLSACGEIPYGGRSNQFLHNNTFYAAVCEWYAARFVRRGETRKAVRFRQAARRALAALGPWLDESPVSHVKNRYPRTSGKAVYSTESDMGCERYAYFDKYMVTMGSWAISALGFLESADAIPVPEEVPAVPSVFETSPDFHLVFLSAGDYSAQLDYSADAHYDCDGLGRLHRRGAPAAICLSVPCAARPNYRIERPNDAEMALAPAVEGALRLVPAGTSLTDGVAVSRWRVAARPDLQWTCTLSAEGLDTVLTGDGPVALTLPALAFDGREDAAITATRNVLTIAYRGWTCSYETDGEIVDTHRSACNRNGVYRRFEARGDTHVRVKVSIRKSGPGAGV